VDAQAHLHAVARQDRDLDLLADHDRLTDSPCQYEHSTYFPGSGDVPAGVQFAQVALDITTSPSPPAYR
jgi:hypothetical protein